MKTEMYTMKEYATKHKLNVNMSDPAATKLLAAHLRERGYTQRRLRFGPRGQRMQKVVWVRDNSLEELAKKLEAL